MSIKDIVDFSNTQAMIFSILIHPETYISHGRTVFFNESILAGPIIFTTSHGEITSTGEFDAIISRNSYLTPQNRLIIDTIPGLRKILDDYIMLEEMR